MEEEVSLQMKELVHPKEKILYRLCVLITIVGVIGSIMAIILGLVDKEEVQTIIGGFAIIFVVIYQLGKMYAKTQVNSIKLSKRQFPEVYEIIEDFAQKLEMKKIPEVYIVQQGGVLNAFAATFFSRDYIQINIDIFEIAYREHKDLDALSFVIGHEMGHIKMGHTKLKYILLTFASNLIPILGATLSRAREYTCDRHASYLCPQGRKSLVLLAAGKHMYKNVDVEEVVKEGQNQKGIFQWFANATASHPVLAKRMKALMDLDTPGRLL